MDHASPLPVRVQVESLVDQLAAAKRDAALGGGSGAMGDGLELATFRSRGAISRQSFRGKTQFAQVAAHHGDGAAGGDGTTRPASGSITRPTSGSFTRQASGSITRQASGSGSSSTGMPRPRGDGSASSLPQGRIARAGSVRERPAAASPSVASPAADQAEVVFQANPLAENP